MKETNYNIDTENSRLFSVFKRYFPHRIVQEDYLPDGYLYNDGYYALEHIVQSIVDDPFPNKLDIKGIEGMVNELWQHPRKEGPIKDYCYSDNYDDLVVVDAVLSYIKCEDHLKKIIHFKGEALKRVNEYVNLDDRFNHILFTEN